MFGTADVSAKFNLEAKANSFSFGLIRDLTEESLLRIKSLWIKEFLSPTESNRGTCLLLKNYIEEDSTDIFGYLNDYSKVNALTVSQISQILPSLDLENIYKFYSADTKK